MFNRLPITANKQTLHFYTDTNRGDDMIQTTHFLHHERDRLTVTICKWIQLDRGPQPIDRSVIELLTKRTDHPLQDHPHYSNIEIHSLASTFPQPAYTLDNTDGNGTNNCRASSNQNHIFYSRANLFNVQLAVHTASWCQKQRF